MTNILALGCIFLCSASETNILPEFFKKVLHLIFQTTPVLKIRGTYFCYSMYKIVFLRLKL